MRPTLLCCRCHAAAATATLLPLLLCCCTVTHVSSVQNGEAPTVRIVANLFREMCYNNKDNLQAGIIVAGWDKHHGGEVYSVPLGGSLHKQPFAIGGTCCTLQCAYFTDAL